jgi:hypothetical protein
MQDDGKLRAKAIPAAFAPLRLEILFAQSFKDDALPDRERMTFAAS